MLDEIKTTPSPSNSDFPMETRVSAGSCTEWQQSLGLLTYRALPAIPGIGPCRGAKEWVLKSPQGEEERRGFGFVVEKADGTAGNFLMLRDPPSRTEEFLVGAPLYGHFVNFKKSTLHADALQPLLVTLDWRTAIDLYRSTGYDTVACLFYENVHSVLTSLVQMEPHRRFVVCFDGHGGEDDNPKLRSFFDLPKGANVTIVPSGKDMSFSDIRARGGYAAIKKHILNFPGGVHMPWPSAYRQAELRMDLPAIAWPSSINGIHVLESLEALVLSYAALDDDAVFIICLWVIFTYAIDSFSFSPILAVFSPEAGCGKSTLFSLLEKLSKLAYSTQLITRTHFTALLNERHETVFIDEAQDLFGNREFVSMLSSSHSRLGLGVTGLSKTGIKKLHNLRATALAYRSAKLPEKLVTRSIPIKMQRRADHEKVGTHQELLTAIQSGHLISIRAQITGWVRDNSNKFTTLPKLSIKSDRANDTYGPLLSIAHAFGEEYFLRAKDIAQEYYIDEEEKNPSRMLLRNIRTALTGEASNRISSKVLAARLCENAAWIWGSHDHGKPLNATLMAHMLGDYAIKTQNMRDGSKVYRGYLIRDFEDVFGRYLPTGDDPEED